MTYAAKQPETATSATTLDAVHDATWWIGQAIALTITIGLVWHGYSGAISAAVGYALAVLVDIRELMARRGSA